MRRSISPSLNTTNHDSFIHSQREKVTIEEVIIEKKKIHDVSLELSRKIHNINRLRFIKCYGFCDLQKLIRLKSLQELHLDVKGEIVNTASLNNLPTLKKLVFKNILFKDEKSPNFASIKTLEEIVISNCKNKRCRIKGCNGLGELHLLHEPDPSESDVVGKVLSSLCGNHNLVKVTCEECKYLINTSPLETINTLEELHFNGCIRLHNIGDLGVLPKLRILDLGKTNITDDALRALSKSKSIVEINCGDCKQLTDSSPLEKIPSLEVISLLRCNNIINIGELGKLPRLRILELGGTGINNDALRGLSETKTLEDIHCSECINLTDVTPLASINSLKRIYLGGGIIPRVKGFDLLCRLTYVELYYSLW